MNPIRVTISATGSGQCALTGREGDGLTVAFEAEPPAFLSWRALRQIVSMKAGRQAKAAVTVPAAAAVAK